MKKIFYALAMLLLVLVGCSQTVSTTQPTQEVHTTTVTSIKDLQTENIFTKHALEHIFYGTTNRQGEVTGLHYEALAKEAHIVSGTKSKPDKHGVYRGKVEKNGVKKTAMSTFFPEQWSAQQVVDAITEAYHNRTFVSGNIYNGTTKDGITIQMYLDDRDKIISAFPKYVK